jgi:hypothetical protein
MPTSEIICTKCTQETEKDVVYIAQ